MISKCIRYITDKGISAFAVKVCERIKWKYSSVKYMKSNDDFAADYIKKMPEGSAKISVCVPLYNTDKIFLRQMIDSVVNQTYKNWQLCLADASDNNSIESIVKQYNDDRIKYKYLNKNDGISLNTNAAADMADGEYIALLDHDDLLDKQALMCFAAAAADGADAVYSDEANFSANPKKPDIVHFKPDFGKYNLRGNNYICHLFMFKKSLFDDIGGLRKDFDGSQDHDLALRLTEKAKKIVHIPIVLYYWRVHKNSVASDITAKPYCIESGRKAVEEQLERLHIDGSVSALKNTAVYKAAYKTLEGKYVFLHGDVEYSHNSKKLLLQHIAQPNVGAVCGLITHRGKVLSGGLYFDGSGYRCAYKGMSTKSDGYMQRLNYAQNISVIDGRFCVIDKAAADAVGGFEESPDGLTDLCIRLEKAGYDILLVPYARAEAKNAENLQVSGDFILKNKKAIEECKCFYPIRI